jgi:sulfur transfer protein SufE
VKAARDEYENLLRSLHVLLASMNDEESDEEEPIREAMDDLWIAMSQTEREEMHQLSIELRVKESR